MIEPGGSSSVTISSRIAKYARSPSDCASAAAGWWTWRGDVVRALGSEGALSAPPPALGFYFTQAVTLARFFATHMAAALSFAIFLPEMRFATKF
jgi:hypothetical protein